MTKEQDNLTTGDAALPSARTDTLALSVIGSSGGGVRPSGMSRWRTLALVAVHLLIIGHVVHWATTGRTLSPVEPSEAMYTLNDGHVNAGLIFFAVALGATLLLGRFVCGWGCHVIAYQDLCRWLLGRIGIRPKPFRSRVLVFAPLALALYMFVWPAVYRWWLGIERPALTNHMMTEEFWKTFPGPVVAVLTIIVCGFVVVYFLGSKGFCTYACPYGGFFGLADKVAPGRIRVNDSCERSGHCTAACTSNVRVHEEVALYGMVVDPGCMKCMDCVSVCPNDALHFGLGRPALGAKPKAPRRNVPYDFSLGEEFLMGAVGVGALLTFRGLYNQIPLLLAMAIAVLTAYLSLKLIRTIRTANVRLQRWQLKRGGRWTRAGVGFAMSVLVFLAFAGHSSLVRYHAWRGHALAQALSVGDEVWAADGGWWSRATMAERGRVEAATAHLTWVDRWGLMSTPAVLHDLARLHLARERHAEAEAVLRRLTRMTPDDTHWVLELAHLLLSVGREAEALTELKRAVTSEPESARARTLQGIALLQLDRVAEGIGALRRAIELDSSAADAYYNLGMARLRQGDTVAAINHLQNATHLNPEFALAHYNLAVATFMSGRPAEALPHIQEAIRLDPNDPDAHGFRRVILQELGGRAGADP